jgi:hypothetical protein
MSFGCKCLTSDIPENISVTGQFAASFQKSDIADLTEKLRAFGEGGLPFPPPEEIAGYVLGRFNWDDVARRTIGVYTARHTLST